LETSGLHHHDNEILSISGRCGTSAFHTYIRPVYPIPAEASRVNGLYASDLAEAPPYEEAALQFVNWIRQTAGPRPLLVAYNGDNFDVPFFSRKNAAIEPSKFPAFEAVYTADPLRVARAVFTPDQVGGSYRQASLYKMLFGAEPGGQHTGQGDVEALDRICKHDTMRSVISASARQLVDLTGQHMLSLIAGKKLVA
jgi:DNA polymerase III alpha subunit (gram-positive type)